MVLPTDRDAVYGVLAEMLPGAPPIGAYAMGIATGTCFERGFIPTRMLLEVMRECSTIAEANARLEEWFADVEHLRKTGQFPRRRGRPRKERDGEAKSLHL
jgi:hypothetical protein